MYRVFVTSETGKPHQVINAYDQRANVETMIAEAQQEGLLAIRSKKFQASHVFFQLVKLSYFKLPNLPMLRSSRKLNLWKTSRQKTGQMTRAVQFGEWHRRDKRSSS